MKAPNAVKVFSIPVLVEGTPAGRAKAYRCRRCGTIQVFGLVPLPYVITRARIHAGRCQGWRPGKLTFRGSLVGFPASDVTITTTDVTGESGPGILRHMKIDKRVTFGPAE